MNPKTIEYVKNITKNITSVNIDLPIHKDDLAFYQKKADELGIGVEQHIKEILVILLLQEKNNRSKWLLLFRNLRIKTIFYYFINFFSEILFTWIVDFI